MPKTGAGYEVVPIPEGHLCCGSAGTYNLLQSDISKQLLKRKIANIDSTNCAVIATRNIGCDHADRKRYLHSTP